MQLNEYVAAHDSQDRYLNFAGIGPMSRPARNRLAEHAALVSESATDPIVGFLEAMAETREVGGRYLGTDADHVTFVSGTSHGLFVVAFGLEAGGNVVVPANEFPANRYPWVRAAGDGRTEVRLIDLPDGRLTAAALAPHVDAGTRAVAISAVGYSSGYRADLETIRSVCGDALLVVDSVQASGAWDVTVGHADVVVAGSQKWMRAGMGGALVGVTDRALERIDPTLVGWTGVEDMFGDAPAPHAALPDASRFAFGSPPFLSMGALRGSMELTLAVGIGTIQAAVEERVAAFEEALLAAGARLMFEFDRDERSSIFTFSMPGRSTEAVGAALAAEGFVFAERDGLIRVSPHATTPLEVADDLRKTLESLG